MPIYRERLAVPPLWWVVGTITMFTFGCIVWTGFDIAITAAVFAALFGVLAAFLLNWGRVVIEVSGGELRVGQDVLPLAAAGQVRPLDEAQARVLRGPRADPRAYVLIRPYLNCAVYVEVDSVSRARHCADSQPEPQCGRRPRRLARREADRSAWMAAPYWLLATRHPAQLAAAIESSRPVVSSGGMIVG